MGGWVTGHCGLDGLSDALGGGLQFAVVDMGVSQRHSGVGVPEHPRDGGQGNALGDRLARDGVPEVVQADVFEPGFLPRPPPEAERVRERFVGISRRRETLKGLRRAAGGRGWPARFCSARPVAARSWCPRG